MANDGSFQINILQGDLDSLKLGNALQSSWETLQQVYASTTAFSLSEDDIDTYDWAGQLITLTPDSSAALIATLPPERQQTPDIGLDHRAFVVTLDGTPVYGGVVVQAGAPMAIKYPVISVKKSGDQLVFRLRPIHSGPGNYSAFEPLWNGIKDQRIHDRFEQIGKLK